MTVTTVLSLATLGSATKNRNDLICVVPPKVHNAHTIETWLCVPVASIIMQKLQCKCGLSLSAKGKLVQLGVIQSQNTAS
jgi:hypothetical protein